MLRRDEGHLLLLHLVVLVGGGLKAAGVKLPIID